MESDFCSADKDKEEALKYLEDYEASLTDAGFKTVSNDEDGTQYYESENGFYNFRYSFLDEDTLSLLFKSEKYISTKETSTESGILMATTIVGVTSFKKIARITIAKPAPMTILDTTLPTIIEM